MPSNRQLPVLVRLLCLLCLLTPSVGAAQDSTSAAQPGTLAVFLDCNTRNCDYDHFRREIQWVNWVRDREYADVHLLITSQRTGSNGDRYTLDYIGSRAFAGQDKSLQFTTRGDDPDTVARNGLTRTIALGLVQFAERSAAAQRLRVIYDAPSGAGAQAAPERDPWNLWVFRLSADGALEGESQQDGYELRGSASARRVAEDLKVEISLRGRYEHEKYDLEDEPDVTNVSENYTAEVLSVWSLTNHWSFGVRGEADRSTFFNRELAVAAGPAVEYNIFPYAESTRRQLTFRYALEGVTFDYAEETVEGKTSERTGRHSLVLGAAVQQPWGEIFGSIEGIQYFHDLATHRINTNINLEYRLFRGFNLDIRGGFSRIKDQFYLPQEDLSEEEILLRRQQRETDYQFDISMGITYQFGSRFANIVNPRMEGGMRRFFFRF